MRHALYHSSHAACISRYRLHNDVSYLRQTACQMTTNSKVTGDGGRKRSTGSFATKGRVFSVFGETHHLDRWRREIIICKAVKDFISKTS